MTPQTQIQQGEDLKSYKLRLCRNKDTYGITWTDISELIGKQTGTKLNESTTRKWFAHYSEGYEDALVENPETPDTYLDDLTIKKLEIQKERVKLSSEKSEINKWVRESSRSELIQEKILEAIKNLKPLTIPKHRIENKSNDKDAILNLADMHYGKDFTVTGFMGEVINEYSPEIFEQRMWYLLNKVVAKIEKEKLTHLNVMNLGDALDGILHKNQLAKLRFGAVEQSIRFGEFIATFLNELSNYVNIDYFSVTGNHAETRALSTQRGELENENLEYVSSHIAGIRLENNPNVTVHQCSKFIYRDIVGVKTLIAHGQNEKNLEQSVKDYFMSYSHPVHLLLTGHLHNRKENTIGMTHEHNIEYIQCPSIVGVDDYALNLKKAAKAGVKMLILERGEGITDEFNIKLN